MCQTFSWFDGIFMADNPKLTISAASTVYIVSVVYVLKLM
ncbi:hypothetical protein LSAJ160_40024 [Latilactobacillus sakei]|nr:hypothetical protein LSAJ160_40024 [Latilactobacillus sakei]